MTDCVHVVTDENHRSAFVRGDVLHFSETLCLKLGVAHGQDLVDQKNFGIEVGGDGEGEPHIHSARVPLDRGVEKPFDFGEGDDLIEFSFDLRALHPEDCAVEENIFASGKLRMKTRPDFEERADAAVNINTAGGWLSDSIENFQQRAFSGAVAPDDSEHFASLHIKGNILERPKCFRCRSSVAAQTLN